MLRYDGFVHAALRKHLPSTVAAAALLLASTGAGMAQSPGGPVSLLFAVPIPVAKTNTTGGMYGFDISFVDQRTQTYYLGDRSNESVDVVDAASGTFIKHIFAKPAFQGVVLNSNGTANNSLSGPNGVTTGGNCLFAGDGNSRVVSFMIPSGVQANAVSTGGSFRADEMAFDLRDGLLLVANNADTPPFGTLLSVNFSNCKLTVGKKIDYPFATNGAEQAVWDPATGLFYQSIPQVGDAANPGGGPLGQIIAINPSGSITEHFNVSYCQPAGLTLDPTTGNLLAGCSVVFDTEGKVWSATDTRTATPYQVILNPVSGFIEAYVPGVGGSDEVWYNSGDDHFYTGSSKDPLGPMLGVVDGTSLTLDQLAPTINVAGVTTGTKPHVSGSSHSVAANAANSWVFVPHPANNVIPGCLTGCIGVYGRADNDSD